MKHCVYVGTVLSGLVSVMAASVYAQTALPGAAQLYPNKAVRLIAPSSPGSGVDIVARFYAQKLSV